MRKTRIQKKGERKEQQRAHGGNLKYGIFIGVKYVLTF